MIRTFTSGYKIAWLPRMLIAALGPLAPFPAAPLQYDAAAAGPAGTKRILFLGDFSAVANRRCPAFSRSFRELCASADIVVVNCESPIVSRSMMPVQTLLGFCHAMKAEFLREVLDRAAITPEKLVVSLANNHIADQGRAGAEETLAALRSMRVTIVGLVPSRPAAWEMVHLANTQIAVLAFTEWTDRDAGLFRDLIRCGAPVGIGDAAPRDVDFACAIPHWGDEFRFRPDEKTRGLAARLAALGADVIAGTHPHVIQPLERVGAALVAYSLGDFLGSVLARSPWRLRVLMALTVDFVPGMPPGSRIAGHAVHIFFRIPLEGEERIESLDALPSRDRERIESFALCVLGASRGSGER